MTSTFIALLLREIRLSARIGGGFYAGIVFYLGLIAMIPFAIGSDPTLLAKIGPAILWIASVLSTLIGLDRLFQADEEDGSLDLLKMSQLPFFWVVFGKCVAHWMTTGLPLTIFAPFLGQLLSLDENSIGTVFLTLLVGTPALTFIGAIGAALTASLRRGGLILSVLVLPLMIPILIFGVLATESSQLGVAHFASHFAILGGLTLLSIVFGVSLSTQALSTTE
ncbi:MAG: heme exporter protein CcmB [Hyphomicrobiales bacterium]